MKGTNMKTIKLDVEDSIFDTVMYFLDTNILIYSYLEDEIKKQTIVNSFTT